MSTFRALVGAFAICLFLASTDVSAQISISGGMGYATFAMSDLKDIHKELIDQAKVDAHTISLFPAYYAPDFTFFYRKKRGNFGAFLSLNSTGSRISYQDYSGSITYNMLASSTQYGVFAGHNFVSEPGRWEVVGSMRFGFINTALQINSNVAVTGSGQQSQAYDFVSTSLLISPGIALTRNFSPWFFASFDTRYLYNIQKDLTLKSDSKVYLMNNTNTPQSADWSGLRLTLSVGLRFIKTPPAK